MILHRKSPLSSKEALDIRNWANSPPAQLFIRILESRLNRIQAEVGEATLDLAEHPLRVGEIEGLQEEYKSIQSCIELLSEAKERSGDLTINEISMGHEYALRFASNDATRTPGSHPNESVARAATRNTKA